MWQYSSYWDEEAQTPLLTSVSNGHEVIVRQVLQHPDINPNSKMSDGTTPLILTTQREYNNVVHLLLEYENFNARGDDSKYYPTIIDTAIGESSGGNRETIKIVQGDHRNINPASNSCLEKRAASPSFKKLSQLKKLRPS